MKKFFIVAAMLVSIMGAASTVSAEITRNGNTFSQVKTEKEKAQPILTVFKFTDSKGNEYPIYISRNGRAFIIRTSAKTGNEYRYYLGETVSREICDAMNIEYKELKKN